MLRHHRSFRSTLASLSVSPLIAVLSGSLLSASAVLGSPLDEERKFQPASLTANQNFGSSVAISAFVPLPPSVIMVGASGNGGAGYSFTGGDWQVVTERLWPSPYAPVTALDRNGFFGHEPAADEGWLHEFVPTFRSVIDDLQVPPSALAGTTSMLIVGGRDWAGDSGRLDTYRYNSSTATWFADPAHFPPEFAGGFGASVAVNDQATLAVVGAPGAGQNGKAYVLFRNGDEWSLLQTLEPPVEWNAQSAAQFGSSVAIEEGWIAVSAPFYDATTTLGLVLVDAGAVQLYSVGGITFDPRLQLSGGAGERFGASVAMDRTLSNHHMMVVGVPGQDSSGLMNHGAAQVYRLDGDVWLWIEELMASDARAGDRLGESVDIYLDDVMVGAPYANRGTGAIFVADTGAAYLFKNTSSEIFVDGFESGNTQEWTSSTP